MAPKYSFGVKVGGDPKDFAHKLPKHLRPRTMEKPGPGTYEARSSLKQNTRHQNSHQDCTWQVAPATNLHGKKVGPGPGQYDHENLEFKNENVRNQKHLKPDSNFPLDARFRGQSTSAALNPGPGQYNPDQSKPKFQKSMLGGKIGESKNYDNYVPGPGTYDMEPKDPIPSFKIMPEQNSNGLAGDRQNSTGPWTYTPKYAHEFFKNKNGVGFGSSVRQDTNGGNKSHVPGPNAYQITGDFDFRDPSKPEQRTGKVPKFAFGMKPTAKPRNLDCPGPGEYETDQYPMN